MSVGYRLRSTEDQNHEAACGVAGRREDTGVRMDGPRETPGRTTPWTALVLGTAIAMIVLVLVIIGTRVGR